MKHLLFVILLLTAPIRADELQLDHSFGATPSTQAIAFSPDATKLAVAGTDGVKIYESATGRVLETHPACRWTTSSVAWSPNGKALAAAGRTFTQAHVGEIWVWRLGQKPLHWTTGKANIDSLAWSPDGMTLGSVGSRDFIDEPGSASACLWNAKTGKLKKTLGHYDNSGASSIVFSRDGKVVAFSSQGDYSSQTNVCDVATGRTLKKWGEAAVPLFLQNQTPIMGNKLLARSLKDGLERRVERIEGTQSVRFTVRKTGADAAIAHTDLGMSCESAAFGGDYLAVLTKGESLQVNDISVSVWKITGKPPVATRVYELGKRTVSPRQLAISADGQTLAVTTQRGTALFDAKFAHLRLLSPRNVTWKQPYSNVALSISRDGSHLFDGRWLDLTGNAPKAVAGASPLNFSQHGGEALSPSGSILAARIGDQGAAGLKSLNAPDTVLTLPPLPYDDEEEEKDKPRSFSFGSAAWAPDNEHVALTGLSDGEGALFLFSSDGKFEKEMKLKGQRLDWGAIAFSPDGKRIVTVGGSAWAPRRGPLLDLWDAATGTHETSIDMTKSKLRGLAIGSLTSVSFSPGGQVIAAGGPIFYNGLFAPQLLFFDAVSGTNISSLPLFHPRSPSWVFLDERRVAILRGNALEVWDFRTHQRERSLFLVPQNDGWIFSEPNL